MLEKKREKETNKKKKEQQDRFLCVLLGKNAADYAF
jgi:hypothetical protein